MSRSTPVKVIVAAGLAVMIAGGSAFALDHAAKLRSGKLVVAAPAPLVFSLPSSNAGATILPVLLDDPSFRRVDRWKTAAKKLRSSDTDTLLKPYRSQIQRLSLRKQLLSLGENATAHVPWLRSSKKTVLMTRAIGLMNTKAMAERTSALHVDAVAFLQPFILFSRNFRTLYVIAPVSVYAWGPVKSFFLDAKTVYASTSLNATQPALSSRGLEGVAASRRNGKAAKNARVRVWFANDAARLKQAVARCLSDLRAPLAQFLAGD